MKFNKRYFMYIGRWQMSSFVLFPIIYLLNDKPLLATILGNLVGGMIFWYVDKWIFRSKKSDNKEIKNEVLV
jgi:membrane protein YqaA with SNARE-associated domain